MNVWWSQTMVQGVGWTLLHFLWQGLVIAALLAIGLRLLRRGPAQYRYLAGCAALLLMTLAPLVTFQLVLKQDEPAPTPVVETMVPDAPAPVERAAPRAVTLPKIVVTATTEARPQKISWRLEPFLPWLVAAWLLGVAGLSCRLFAGWLQIRRLRRADAEALADGWPGKLAELARRLGVNRPLRLLRTACVEVPTVIGWLRPVILLPAACLTGLTPAQLESILAHELAHIRRHDYLINLLQSAVETLLFYHPAVWWVSRRIREERENCCDDLVVEVCGDRVGYARALATLEELRPASAQLALAAGGAPLLQRIRRVLGQGERSAGRPAWPLAGVLVVVLLAVTAAGLRGHRALAASDGIVAPPKIKNAAGSGSTATDPTAIMNIPKTGPNAWLVDGSNQLNQQWFWYGVTNPGNGAVHAESNASSQAGMFNWTVGGANAINKSESMSESNRVLFNQAWELYKKLNAERGHDTSNGTLYVQLNTSNQSGGGSNLLDQASSGGGSNQVQVNRLIQDGKFYFEAGKYSEADARFTQALKLDPANLVASQYVALIGEKRDLNALNNPPSSPNPFNRTNLVYTGKGRQIIFDKLNRIRIDKVNYANLPLKDVLDDLMKITKDRDPGGKGINFFFDRESPRATNAAPAIDPATGLRVGGADESDVSQVRVNISLNDVRLADVLDAITKTSDRPIKYSVLDYAIVFALRGDGGPLEIRTFLVDPNTFIQGLESVTGKALGGGTGAGVNVVPGGGGGTGGSAGGVGGLGGGGAIGGSGGGQAFVTPVTTSTVTSNIQSAVRQYFTAAGVDLNTNLGKVVIYNERRGTLTIRATSLDLDVIEAAIQTLNTPTTPTTRTNQSAALQTRTFRVDPRIFLTGFQGDSGKPLAGGDAGSNTNSAEIQRAIRRYFGNAGVDLSTNAGKVVIFNDRKGTLTVRATPQDLDLIEAAVAQLNQPVPQVNIKAKFVEITQDDRGALGFEWNIGGFRYDAPTNNGSSNMSDSNGQPQGAVYFPTGPLKIDSKTNVATTNSVPIVGPQKSTEVASITGILTDPQYRAVLQAFDQRTSVNTLSMNITTESGRQAQMQSGDVQNITVFDGTNSKVKEFHLGPALDVLAEVSADEFTVHVDLTPSVTEFLGYDKVGSVIPPGGSNATNAALVPRFRVQQVHTTVNVWDGQTVVIGGIAPYDDTRQVKDKVPLLGDIPLLGRLFQSEHSQKVKKNLMVFVTVTIINPDGTRYHSDAEMPFVKTSVPPQAGTNAPPKR